jgi:hypothetical protein
LGLIVPFGEAEERAAFQIKNMCLRKQAMEFFLGIIGIGLQKDSICEPRGQRITSSLF